MNPLDFLSGYKTYLAAVGTLASGVVQLCNGDVVGGLTTIMTAAGLICARRAVDR